MLVVAFIVLIYAFLGLIIFLRNTRSQINQLFLLLALSTALWSIASYLTDMAPINQRLIWGKLAFVFPVLFTLSLALLARVFPLRLRSSPVYMVGVSVLALFNIVISCSGLVVAGAHYRPGTTDLLPGSFYGVFVVVELILFGAALSSYLLSRRRANALQRAQANIVGIGVLIGFTSALLFNAILPLFTTANTARFGPLGSLFFVCLTAYAIVRHRLFNIRAVVVRSMGYLLSVVSFTLLYVALGFLIIGHLFLGNQHVPVKLQLIYTGLAILMAYTFPRLKQFFDTVTSNLFYRDAYSSQAFLDDFNKLIVSTFELDPLLEKSAVMVSQTLKPTYCTFMINETANAAQHFAGTGGVSHLKSEDLAQIRKLALAFHQKIIVTDELDERHRHLQELLRRNNVDIIARMAPAERVEGVGYLLLGPKKSGNPFSAQDIHIIEIIANEFVIAIQNALHFEEIQNFNETLQERVVDATHKLRQTNVKLQALDATKDEFITMASHQLRTPLTSVKGYLSMVLEGDAGKLNKQQAELLNQSYVSAQRMVYLISDLLNLSRLNTGKFVIELAPVDLAAVVQAEINQVRETAKSRGVSLTFEPPADFPTLLLDETKIHQVVMNFVDNAIYYTPAGGAITVSLRQMPSAVEFLVQDTGIGVPKAEQHKLFAKFYRAGNARRARPDGTGLGLFMAKKVIIAQGGAIIFDSEEGKGSTFGFRFSKAKHLAPAETKEN